ncbi:hypothetical protein QQ045_024991 [Rhodiola kirilowii]
MFMTSNIGGQAAAAKESADKLRQGEEYQQTLNLVEAGEGEEVDLCSFVPDTQAAAAKELIGVESDLVVESGGKDISKCNISLAEEFSEYVSKSALKRARKKERKRIRGEDSNTITSSGSKEENVAGRRSVVKEKKMEKIRLSYKKIDGISPLRVAVRALLGRVCVARFLMAGLGSFCCGMKRFFQISQIVRHSHFIYCRVQYGTFSFAACFVYASNLASDRAIMWKELETIVRNDAGRWLCLGDFNCILKMEE